MSALFVTPEPKPLIDLSVLVSKTTPVVEAEPEHALVPPVPETIDETGLSISTVEQLVFKFLYFRGDILGRDLATAMGFKFSLIDPLIENLKRQHLIQVKKSLGMGSSGSVFALTEAGRNLTREYLENNQYTGPAPVPLFQYTWFARHQRRKAGWLTPDALAHAYRKMVVTKKLLSEIGPAVGSGNSFLIYGQPGNGKTYLAEALGGLDDAPIFIPHAIECQGQIVQLFDPIYHSPVEDAGNESAIFEPTHDGRWIKCRRPFITSGGELTMQMLDLSYNETSKVYDAPYQLKANNGIYLIDDFGRQRCTPAEVLNRWIVPMERRVDYLSFRTGSKMTVPFEAFLVFSTNLKPAPLGDEAFLRRIQYKMLMRSPDQDEFRKIFESFCASREFPFERSLLDRFIEKNYKKTGKVFRRCHPRDVLSHVIDLIHFEGMPFRLTEDLLDRAFESCFVQDEE